MVEVAAGLVGEVFAVACVQVRLMPLSRFLSCNQLSGVSSSSELPTMVTFVWLLLFGCTESVLTKSMGSVATRTILPPDWGSESGSRNTKQNYLFTI